jgi:hypothetical protein
MTSHPLIPRALITIHKKFTLSLFMLIPLFSFCVSLPDFVPDEHVRHLECFNIVRVVERETAAHKSPADVLPGLLTHCGRLPDARKNICLALVPDQVERMIALLAESKRPDEICEGLGYARSLRSGRFIEKDKCSELVDVIRKENENSAALPKEDDAAAVLRPHRGDGPGRMGVPRVCRDLPHDQRIVCMIIARFVGRGNGVDDVSAMAPDVVCEKLYDRRLIKPGEPEANSSRPR